MNYLYFYLSYLFQINTKFCTLIIFFIGCVMYNIYLYMIYKVFYELYIAFHDRTNVGIGSYKNPWNNQWVFVPLDYKIFDLKITNIRILLLSILGMGPFLILRFLRLGVKINLLYYYNILSLFPAISVAFLVITIIHYLFVISILFFNIYARLYKELKKLYLYLLQFGGELDIKTYYKMDKKDHHKMIKAYIHDYFIQRIYEYTFLKYELFLYRLEKKFVESTYKKKYTINKKFTEWIIFLLQEFSLSIPLFYKSILYIIPVFVISYEVYFYNYTLYYTYYVFFGLFIYKQVYNIMYFSWYHNIGMDTFLAFYYYRDFKLLFLESPSSYASYLRILYSCHSTSENSEHLFYYLNTGLNGFQSVAVFNKEDWPKYPTYYKKLSNILKNYIISILLILGSLTLMFLGFFYVKDIFLFIDWFYPIQSPLTIDGNLIFLKEYFILKIQYLSIDKQIYLLKIFKIIPYYELLQSKTMNEIKIYVDNLIVTYEYLENNIYPLLKDHLRNQDYHEKIQANKRNIVITILLKIIPSLI